MAAQKKPRKATSSRAKAVTPKSRRKACDFPECFHELTISKEEWESLRKHAVHLNLNDGSFYDARIGAINFWCGPENKPKGWPDEIEQGLLRYPRSFVGCFYVDGFKARTVTLHFEVAAYARADAAEAAGAVTFGSAVYQKKLHGTKADQQWILKQFDLLRQHARLMDGL
jgi:hypothetical protein